jgi:dihydrofolate reductase
MAKLIYSMITSLDGYAEAAEGGLGTGADDQEVHTFINDLFRPVGTYLYGRRMYETMVYWETAHTEPDQPPHILQYARDWQAAEKIVYSTTLESVSSAKTRIERTFDPDAVRKLKAEADHDLTVDGPNLAAQAIAAGLVDEYHLFITTSVVGGGKRFFADGVRLLDELAGVLASSGSLISSRAHTTLRDVGVSRCRSSKTAPAPRAPRRQLSRSWPARTPQPVRARRPSARSPPGSGSPRARRTHGPWAAVR